MVGIKKAPILHHFSQTISGAATIRCFNQEDHFHSKVFHFIDDYSRIAFHNSATMEWLCVRVNFLFNLVFFALLVILVTIPRSSLDPSKSIFLYITTFYIELIKRLDLIHFMFVMIRSCRISSNLWSEFECSSSMGDMEPLQCGE